MDLTDSWMTAVPEDIQVRYALIETRNAASILAATSPDEFADLCRVLSAFQLTAPMLVNPGGNKSIVARELDEAFRRSGWREAAYEQTILTRLIINPWRKGGEQHGATREARNVNAGHQVDNVRGRVALDVEWNAKDGNLDRDLANFRALYDAGEIDGGVIITRTAGGLQRLASELVRRAKQAANESGEPRKIAAAQRRKGEPLQTQTTTTLDKLLPRLARGDGGGCPVLVFAITERCFVPSATDAEAVLGPAVGTTADDGDDPDGPDGMEEQ